MRPRKLENRKDAVENFYISKNGHCRYRRPDTKEFISLGYNVEEAKRAARQANEGLVTRSNLLGRILGEAEKPDLVGEHLDYMLTHWSERVMNKTMSGQTYDGYRRQLEGFRKEHGSLVMNKGPELSNTITKKHLATYLDSLKPTMRKNVRAMLKTVWTHAVGRSWADTNIASDTMSFAKYIKVQRERLTTDVYKKIRECAPPHYQNIFDFAVQILQRREDLAALEKTQLVKEPNAEGRIVTFLLLKQIKSDAPLKIELGPEIEATLQKLKDNVISRHILHRPYTEERNRVKIGQGYLPDNLTRAFAEARDLAIEKYGLFKDWSPAQYPTFHELRGYGAKRYKEAGIDPQLLLGHETAEMTKLYLSRHEVEWIVSKAGIAI